MVSKKRARPPAGGPPPPKLEERVVKCCLARCLKIPGAAAILEDYVCNTSKLLHRGSLALTHCLLRRLAAGEAVTSAMLKDQMLYYTFFCLEAGASGSTKYPFAQTYYEQAAPEFHEQATCRLVNVGTVINAAARQFRDNVCTSLGETFHFKYNCRVTRVAGLAIPNYRTRFSAALCAHVFRRPAHRYAAEGPLDELHWKFIRRVRGFLGATEDEEIPTWWGEQNMDRALRFRYELLKYHEESEEASGRRAKRFLLFPEVTQMRHFITIDAAFLRCILIRIGACDVTQKVFNEQREAYQRKLFRCRASWKLSNTIQTDGVAVCFHVMTPATEEPEPPAAKLKLRKKAAVLKKEGGPTSSSAPPYEAPQPLVPPGAPVAANDPGRYNIAAVVQLVDGVETRYRLTRKQYYEDSHANKNIERRIKWDAVIEEEREALRSSRRRTASVAAFEDYLRVRKQHSDALWRETLKRRTSLLAMDSYIHKRKAMDTFWRRHLGTQRDIYVAWGDGSFSAGGRGERSVPKEKMKQASKRFALKVVDVDESFTTAKCCDCGHAVIPVWVRRPAGRRIEVRGLRRCISNGCREIPLKSRDYAAARNILRIALEAERPAYLCAP